MRIQTLCPCVLVTAASLFLTTGAIAQNNSGPGSPSPATVNSKAPGAQPTQSAIVTGTRPRVATPEIAAPAIAAPAIVSPAMATPVIASPVIAAPSTLTPVISVTNRFDQSLLVAIQSHLGATYHFNRTGPEEFDCSGLVWRSFQDVGVIFERGPARSYWATFAAPPKDQEFKFGTLVFFNNLRHVGIVVDDKGFYHSARHGGVMYSPFNEYWLSRIDGFRRVPTQPLPIPATAAKNVTAKPSPAIAVVQQQ